MNKCVIVLCAGNSQHDLQTARNPCVSVCMAYVFVSASVVCVCVIYNYWRQIFKFTGLMETEWGERGGWWSSATDRDQMGGEIVQKWLRWVRDKGYEGYGYAYEKCGHTSGKCVELVLAAWWHPTPSQHSLSQTLNPSFTFYHIRNGWFEENADNDSSLIFHWERPEAVGQTAAHQKSALIDSYISATLTAFDHLDRFDLTSRQRLLQRVQSVVRAAHCWPHHNITNLQIPHI